MKGYPPKWHSLVNEDSPGWYIIRRHIGELTINICSLEEIKEFF